ncbi:meiotic nuclear division protein 1 homolog [Stylonychia lemnae]|uniref:Meiotic nuclear division protein 1 homolog n=1 Tax=Stylonychia lemnae TaxID=5949 RepID=A0A078ASC6_STYLE|nr:meiotic nuclear division protein 1 homolog [Stylonychia lemnae]|eukprot:CDW83788.1 meiotic nuclear division protein 1 homolog [Stylonychia lemnae]
MGGKKKGLSFEDKRSKLLEVYYEKKEVLNLKELEKWGPKKGIVLQTVKDVNQSLIDDNMVQTDKIGAGAFFWALPSQGFQVRKNLIQDYDTKIEKAKQDILDTKANIERTLADRDNKDGTRENLLEELGTLQKEKAKLDCEYKNYERSDPKIILKMEDDTKIAQSAVNRWTDNLYQILQWIQQSKPNFTQKDLESNFPIYKNLDYME